MGRKIGILSSLVLMVLWIVFACYVVNTKIIAMLILSVLGAIPAYYKNPWLILLAFAVQFCPVGLYLCGVPGWARFIGYFEILYAISALILIWEKWKEKQPRPTLLLWINF